MTKNTLLILALLGLVRLAPCNGQSVPGSIDLSKFPAAEVEDVVVPVPSEIFSVLDKLGSPNWRSELREPSGKSTGNRAQVALRLGTVIAEGFIAVEAEDATRVQEIGRQVLVLAEAINVRKAVIARSKSITEKADAKDWKAVRKEFDGALHDVRGAMQELGDDELAQLVSIGGWLRGTEVLTSIVSKNYSPDGAELLFQPQLLDYFTRKLDGLRNTRLGKEELVVRIRKTIAAIRPIIGRDDSVTISADSVQRINKMTSEMVAAIVSKES